jgi:NAD-dependent DNA ligase
MNEIIKRISYLRKEILINSYLYYFKDFNIISDYEYDKMAEELYLLVRENPEAALSADYCNEFKEWDEANEESFSCTGFNLPYLSLNEITSEGDLRLNESGLIS